MVSGGPSSSERNDSNRVSDDDAPQSEAVTRLLARVRQGDFAAREELLPLVYGELRRLAGIAFSRETPGSTLQPTALVHEAFIRLFSGPVPAFTDRAHFLGISARVMRQVLVDHARARRAQKRGAQFTIQLDDQMAAAAGNSDLLLIDQALDKLAGEDPLLVTLIEMRFFAGMTAEETAEARGESVHVVRHDLRYAQARLRQIVLGDSQPPL
jgi:RNA polymerase sigma factor (TIGR02999 family)